jgi:hypothetical protein
MGVHGLQNDARLSREFHAEGQVPMNKLRTAFYGHAETGRSARPKAVYPPPGYIASF